MICCHIINKYKNTWQVIFTDWFVNISLDICVKELYVHWRNVLVKLTWIQRFKLFLFVEGIKIEYMEALTRSNDIEEIQQLMEQFKIIEKENNQIIKVEMIE